METHIHIIILGIVSRKSLYEKYQRHGNNIKFKVHIPKCQVYKRGERADKTMIHISWMGKKMHEIINATFAYFHLAKPKSFVRFLFFLAL